MNFLCSLQIACVCTVFLLYITGSQSVLHTICNGYFEVKYLFIYINNVLLKINVELL